MSDINNVKELIKQLFSGHPKDTDEEYFQKLTSFMDSMTEEEKLTIRMLMYRVESFSKRNEEQLPMKRQIVCEYNPFDLTETEEKKFKEDLIKNFISITKIEGVEDLMEIYNECFSEM